MFIYPPTARLNKCGFISYSCAAIDKISTDVGRRAVPRQ